MKQVPQYPTRSYNAHEEIDRRYLNQKNTGISEAERRKMWGGARMKIAAEHLTPEQRGYFRDRVTAGEDWIGLAQEMETLVRIHETTLGDIETPKVCIHEWEDKTERNESTDPIMAIEVCTECGGVREPPQEAL